METVSSRPIKTLRVHQQDNVGVALTDLLPGEEYFLGNRDITLIEKIPAKHKFMLESVSPGDKIIMYGVLVGKATEHISEGGLVSTRNIKHAADEFEVKETRKVDWQPPDITKFQGKKFMGYHRSDGSVGTANYWLVIPMVFCENRNLDVLKQALIDDLGYGRNQSYKLQTRKLLELYQSGRSVSDILESDLLVEDSVIRAERPFKNVDGIRFLTHEGGCGGTRQDAQALCGLLAGYITNPNVAGVTVLSLGCQHAQLTMLEEEIHRRDTAFSKPYYALEQQKIGSETKIISESLRKTFAGLIEANKCKREETPLSKLCLGLECGGSDGFSGISANPAIGHTSDLLVALGGTVVLSEFPELCGVEQELSDRCLSREVAERFGNLMRTYNERAQAVGSGFDMNPSPGNIRDGLITDAIKSAGASRKGGTSPVTDVLDYPEKVRKAGLNLLCTPGNDVESTTAEVATGANIVLFTTGLGTPTGNPIAPVVKISTNTNLFNRMRDIIDINTGTIIEGTESIEAAGERILEYVIHVASGEETVAAVRHGQEDFIPWKRGVSL